MVVDQEEVLVGGGARLGKDVHVRPSGEGEVDGPRRELLDRVLHLHPAVERLGVGLADGVGHVEEEVVRDAAGLVLPLVPVEGHRRGRRTPPTWRPRGPGCTARRRSRWFRASGSPPCGRNTGRRSPGRSGRGDGTGAGTETVSEGPPGWGPSPRLRGTAPLYPRRLDAQCASEQARRRRTSACPPSPARAPKRER